MKQPPNILFKAARLGEVGVKLDDGNPAFIRWLRYVRKYRAVKGELAFGDANLLGLLKQTKSEAELMTLFVSLTKVSGLEDLAQSMIWKSVWGSSLRHKLLNDAWLKAKERPDEIFKILELQRHVKANEPTFLEWLRYTKRYMTTVEDSFPVVNFLSTKVEEQYIAVLFQSLKGVDDLKLLEKLQIQLFEKWMNEMKLKPKQLADIFGDSRGMILKRGDPKFGALETYTLQFVEHQGDKAVIERVKVFFANNDLRAALAAADKV